MKQQIKEQLRLWRMTPQRITGNPGLQTGVRSRLSLLLAPDKEYLI
jgi:hypothetical protein